MSGPLLIFSSIFPVCFRAAAIVCFMSSESEITAETSSELLTRHEPSRGAGRRRRLFVKFSEYFLPPLLFSEKCWPLVSRAGLVICEISLSRQTDNDRLARLPLLLHHYHTKTGDMGSPGWLDWRGKLSSEKIIWALSAFLVRAWNILTLLWASEMRPGAS